MTRLRSRLRRRLGLLVVPAVLVLLVTSASSAAAHPLSTSAVLLDVGPDAVTATVEIPLDELSVARDQVLTAGSVLAAGTLEELRAYVRDHLSASDASGRGWSTVVSGGRVEPVDGVDNLVLDAVLTPSSGPVGDFVLHDDAVIDQLVSHRVFVSGRYGHAGAYTTLAMLSWQTRSVPVEAAVSSSAASPAGSTDVRGFGSAVRLGLQHIAAGSDHLLFLVLLLLPAPLVAVGRRWRPSPRTGPADLARSGLRVVHVVTAFAVGHSCTLALGALGWVELPTRLVESGIALSVLVSAVHAVRPLVRRGEVWIAGGFGLLHGLSFAAVLGSLDLTRTSLVSTLLGFNVGIELAQLAVLALVLPSLLLLSRTSAYRFLRPAVATVGAVLAAGWLLDRIGWIPANPLEPVGDLLVDHPYALAVALGLLALALTGIRRVRQQPSGSMVSALPGGPTVAARSAGGRAGPGRR